MSTRSTITIKRKDGTSTSIYCHSDGYIEGVGIILQLAYNTAEKVEELLKLGDLSSIGYYTEPNPENGEHNFENRQDGVCCAYHRDRGEEFRQTAGQNEYNYTFDEEESVWFVEMERFIDKTEGTRFLNLDYYLGYEKKLLIEEIMRSDVDTSGNWEDDEFAKAGEVIEKCKEKAYEARAKRIQEKQEIFDSYYRAYCD